MKKTIWLFGALLLVLSACKKDDNEFDFENVINYDGENNTAPFLPAGDHETAARFTATELSEYVGRELIEVSFYIFNIPQACTIKIYNQGDRDKPGTVVYSATVSNSLSPFSWNTHEIRTPVAINGDDLWISIAVTHDLALQSVGCDAGPADPNGDWLLLSTEQNWSTYRLLANESINWNTRGRGSAEGTLSGLMRRV